MPLVPPIALPERAPVAAVTAPLLVDGHWLVEHVDDVVVIDTRRADAYAAARVPGARSLPLDALLVEDSSRPALERLSLVAQRALAGLGVVPEDHVLLVDDADGSASLGAVVCELAGLRRVSAMWGSGTDAWQSHGLALDRTPPSAPAVAHPDSWAHAAPDTSAIAAFEDVVDALVTGTGRVVDARSQLEHEGIVGAPCCPARGAIPGSVHLEWTALFGLAGDPLPAERVHVIARHMGIDPDAPIIVSCHAGHRAAIAARVLRSVGFSDVRVSLGSWHEWATRGLADGAAPAR